MVQKYITIRISDLSGTELAEGEGDTISFTIGRNSYVLDLTSDEVGKFYDVLKPYTDVARKGESSSRAAAAPKAPKQDLAAVRAWASSNGYQVSTRGRIPGSIMEAYEAAN